MYLVISASLNPSSRSRILALEALARLQEHSKHAQLVDLQQWRLPQCDGESCYDDAEVLRLAGLIQASRGILLATPVYNYDVSATAKNVIELTGQAWSDKVVGIVCAAGSPVSYMALMGLANSLMLDFHSLIVPRFVFATGEAFDGENRISDPEILQRLSNLVQRLVRIAEALA